MVLAKGGIFLPDALDDVRLQNDFITNLFFSRKHDDVIRTKIKTGVRDMGTFDADLVDKSLLISGSQVRALVRSPFFIITSDTQSKRSTARFDPEKL